MSLRDDTVLTAVGGPAPLCHRWNDEVVVYHTLSADTHLLAAPGAALLDIICRGPQPVSAIRGAFLAEYAGPVDADAAAVYVETALEQFLAIDLVQVQGGGPD